MTLLLLSSFLTHCDPFGFIRLCTVIFLISVLIFLNVRCYKIQLLPRKNSHFSKKKNHLQRVNQVCFAISTCSSQILGFPIFHSHRQQEAGLDIKPGAGRNSVFHSHCGTLFMIQPIFPSPSTGSGCEVVICD